MTLDQIYREHKSHGAILGVGFVACARCLDYRIEQTPDGLLYTVGGEPVHMPQVGERVSVSAALREREGVVEEVKSYEVLVAYGTLHFNERGEPFGKEWVFISRMRPVTYPGVEGEVDRYTFWAIFWGDVARRRVQDGKAAAAAQFASECYHNVRRAARLLAWLRRRGRFYTPKAYRPEFETVSLTD